MNKRLFTYIPLLITWPDTFWSLENWLAGCRLFYFHSSNLFFAWCLCLYSIFDKFEMMTNAFFLWFQGINDNWWWWITFCTFCMTKTLIFSIFSWKLIELQKARHIPFLAAGGGLDVDPPDSATTSMLGDPGRASRSSTVIGRDLTCFVPLTSKRKQNYQVQRFW